MIFAGGSAACQEVGRSLFRSLVSEIEQSEIQKDLSIGLFAGDAEELEQFCTAMRWLLLLGLSTPGDARGGSSTLTRGAYPDDKTEYG